MNGGGARKWARKWNLRRYLVAGVLVWLPILATVWVVSFVLHLMDLTLKILPPAFRPEALVGFSLPGVGAVFALIVVLLTGLLVTNLIGRRLIVYGEELLNRIPLVGTVYGGVKSFAESVFSQSNAFRKVVMIEYRGVSRDRATAYGGGARHVGRCRHEDDHHLRCGGASGLSPYDPTREARGLSAPCRPCGCLCAEPRSHFQR